MNQPVTYVELQSADLDRSAAFFSAVFGWRPQPFAAQDYLVAGHGDGPGIDAGLLTSQDGQPRSVAVIRVEDLDVAMSAVTANGGAVVVPPFTISGVGRGCYITDPTGLIVGPHHYDPSA